MVDLDQAHAATTSALTFSRLSLVQRQCLVQAKETGLAKGKSGWRDAFTTRTARSFSASTVGALIKLGLLEKTLQGRLFCTEAGKAELLRPLPPHRARRPAQLEQLTQADQARQQRLEARMAEPKPQIVRLPYADN